MWLQDCPAVSQVGAEAEQQRELLPNPRGLPAGLPAQGVGRPRCYPAQSQDGQPEAGLTNQWVTTHVFPVPDLATFLVPFLLF